MVPKNGFERNNDEDDDEETEETEEIEEEEHVVGLIIIAFIRERRGKRSGVACVRVFVRKF